MNPDQPSTQPPAVTPNPNSADYLNQIAPQTPKRPLLRPTPKLFAIIGGGLVLLIIILSITVNIVSSAQRDPLRHLAARLESTAEISADAQMNLKDSKLRSLNSSLSLFLTNTNRDIVAPLAASGVEVGKIGKEIVQKESGDDVEATLEDARLNAKYDRVYAREMSYVLQNLLTQMQDIYASTGNQSLKEFLQTTYRNLEPTQASFDAYNTASE
jgi:hypothetical protein